MEAEKVKVVNLKAIEATPENFEAYGQVILPSPDGVEFGPRDAQLDLSQGIPRLYIMHLEKQKLKFSRITHHARVTQCLGSIGGQVWYLGVAKPSLVNQANANALSCKKIIEAPSGHSYEPPNVDEVQVFKITGTKFLKLNAGTWHAGPLFVPDAMDFYNLELADTDEVDRTTHYFIKDDGVRFVIEE